MIKFRSGIHTSNPSARIRESLIEITSWDNKNEFETFFPYMQDAAAYMIYVDRINTRVFVSMHDI